MVLAFKVEPSLICKCKESNLLPLCTTIIINFPLISLMVLVLICILVCICGGMYSILHVSQFLLIM